MTLTNTFLLEPVQHQSFAHTIPGRTPNYQTPALLRSSCAYIHAGAGGTGQAAIQVAQHFGATVYVTVGSEGKKKVLMSTYDIPEDHIFYSRNACEGNYGYHRQQRSRCDSQLTLWRRALCFLGEHCASTYSFSLSKVTLLNWSPVRTICRDWETGHQRSCQTSDVAIQQTRKFYGHRLLLHYARTAINRDRVLGGNHVFDGGEEVAPSGAIPDFQGLTNRSSLRISSMRPEFWEGGSGDALR